MVPGLIMAVVGFLLFLFLVVYPEDVGCTPPDPVLPSVSIFFFFKLNAKKLIRNYDWVYLKQNLINMQRQLWGYRSSFFRLGLHHLLGFLVFLIIRGFMSCCLGYQCFILFTITG